MADQMRLPTLPRDVVLYILSRLPVKSLMRFRCVSKFMNSLVHDPQFIKMHMNHLEGTPWRRVLVTTDPPQIILCEAVGDENAGQGVTMRIDYPSLLPADDIQIVGSCNGLLCFMIPDSLERFVLWNPSTRACREIPKPGPVIGLYPDTVPIYGFGYDPATNDYKVIRAVSDYPGTTSVELEIYTLRDNVWRTMLATLPCILTDSYWRKIEPWFPGLMTRGAGAYTNGALHWLEKRHESDIILSLNLVKEQFEEVIPLVDYDKEDSYLRELRVFGGDLSVLVHKYNVSEIEIWVMKEHGVRGSWTKIATMPDNPGPVFVDSFMDDWLVPFCSCPNGCLLVDMDGSEVLMYDQQMKTFSKLELERNNEEMFLVQEFVESLVSPYAV